MTNGSDYRNLSDDVVIKATQTSKEVYIEINSWQVIENREKREILQLVCYCCRQLLGPQSTRHEAVHKIASAGRVVNYIS